MALKLRVQLFEEEAVDLLELLVPSMKKQSG